MPLFETNVMRTCVRSPTNYTYDARVPIFSDHGGMHGDGTCADSQYETPYMFDNVDEADVNQVSMGSVPLWDGVWPASGDSKYPASIRKIQNTLVGARSSRAFLPCEDEIHHTSTCTKDLVSIFIFLFPGLKRGSSRNNILCKST